ncbi:MAG: Asparagine synthase (glutamine-hydrolyzing) [Candidatus Methanohalarchaeum thermophilum]|uniref:Asparagine synthase (Glutamine-hydrolyzing) n=1 Tax=Methanohalarchaeum thermophilum TaxID=1903181 RepID=A0A1Q6DTI8_METT1|nr:MAG: Asparagine synthase (glutamine-hydrolyzing) [Candidatus Methanohalarchaeum thermophilum]
MSNEKSFDQICKRLRKKLDETVKEISYDGTALSGGLDTSIVNYIASNHKSDLESVSVGFDESSMEDLEYAKKVADELDIVNHTRIFSFDEALEVAKKVIEILETFDPMEIRNSISIYFMLEKAKQVGLNKILTGDGSDELFAGYSFLYKLPEEELPNKLDRISKIMKFSSEPIAKDLGLEAKLPFIEEDFKRFAQNIDPNFLVGERDGKKIGKWILRKAYEGRLPDELIWRRKAPIEVGSGTTIFPEKFDSMIGDRDFEERKNEIKENDGVTIRSKEQLHYYKLYKTKFGVPEASDSKKRICPFCGTNLPKKANFCRTCGNGVEQE